MEPVGVAEGELLVAFREGRRAEFAGRSDTDRVIRGAFIRHLLTGSAGRGNLVSAWDALIKGDLDLADLGSPDAPAPGVDLRGASAAESGKDGISVNARGSFLRTVAISKANIASFDADQVNLTLGMSLEESIFSQNSPIRLRDSRIGGACDLDRIRSKDYFGGPLVELDGADIRGDLRAQGARLQRLDLFDTRISRNVSIRAAIIGSAPHARAINADRMVIGANCSFDGILAIGEIRLVGANIGGQFSMSGLSSHLAKAFGRTEPEETVEEESLLPCSIYSAARALSCDQIKIGNNASISESKIIGQIRFPTSQIQGGFSFRVSDVFSSEKSMSDRLVSDLGFKSDDLKKIHLESAHALDFTGSVIEQDLVLRACSLHGSMDLTNANIGGALIATLATIRATEGWPAAATGSGVRVGGDLVLGWHYDEYRSRGELTEEMRQRIKDHAPFEAAGRIAFDRCEIGGSIILNGVRIEPAVNTARNQDPDWDVALSLEQGRAGARLEVHDLAPQASGIIDLRGFHCAVLDDRGGAGWGDPCATDQPPCNADGARDSGVQLRLDGFTYDRIADFDEGSSKGGARSLLRDRRLAFLMRQFPGSKPRTTDYTPQPFEQVIRTLRSEGHPDDADFFAFEKRVFRTKCRVDRWFMRLWHALVSVFFGHYYSVSRAIATLLVFIATGTVLLMLANASGAYVKKRPEVFLSPETFSTQRLADPPPGTMGPPQREACWDAKSFDNAHLFGWRLDALPGANGLLTVLEGSVMSLDLLLPLIDLKQDQRCEIDTDRGQHRLWAILLAIFSGFGLLVVPLFLATVSGLARRD